MFSTINVARVGLRAAAPRGAARQQGQMFKRNVTDQHGKKTDDKPKLAFRFGMRDVPVELYPMAVCVVAACIGGGFALTKQFWKDGADLRMVPTSMRKKVASASEEH